MQTKPAALKGFKVGEEHPSTSFSFHVTGQTPWQHSNTQGSLFQGNTDDYTAETVIGQGKVVQQMKNTSCFFPLEKKP